MSTRSYICVEQPNGTIKGIFCHSDGYLTYNGAMLVDHYNKREKVEELISLGNLYCLEPKLHPNPKKPHSFDYRERQKNVCVFYTRDRGETGQDAKVIPLKTLLNDPWIEYIYIFTKDNKWKYYEGYNTATERDVKKDLDAMFSEWGIKRPKNLYGWYSEEDVENIAEEQKSKAKA